MTEVVVNCPYKDMECPKLEECKKEHSPLSRKVDFLIAIVLIIHGAELLAIMGLS